MEQVSTARASALDLMHCSSRSTIAIGPISGLDPQVVLDRYTRLARVGPAARIGLWATSDNRWKCSTEVADRVVVLPASDDPQALLTSFREPGITRTRVGVAGQYLLIDYNHGVGDIALLSRFIEVIIAGVDPQNPDLWRRTALPPLLTATARTYANPLRLLRMAAWYRRNRDLAPPLTAPGRDTAQVRPQSAAVIPSTAIARIPAASVQRLRAWRDEHQPGVSVVTLIVFALRAAFEKAGIEPTDRVTLPFDARVYLPKNTHTLGNFAAGLDFDCGPEVTPQSLQAAITEAFTIGRPVANLVVSSLKVRAGRRAGRTRPMPSSADAADQRVSLLYSSLNTVPRTATIPWDDTAPAQFLVASDPAAATSVTVTSAMADGDMTFTATFYDTVYEPQSVVSALNLATGDTIALLRNHS